MSRSTPQRRLACAKCREKDTHRVLVSEGLTGVYEPTWFNVVAVSRRGRQVLCRCRTCGHEYATNSTAAHRAIRYAEHLAATIACRTAPEGHNGEVRGASAAFCYNLGGGESLKQQIAEYREMEAAEREWQKTHNAA